MIDLNTLMPMLKAMNMGGNKNFSQIESMMSMLGNISNMNNNNSSNKSNYESPKESPKESSQMNNMMNILPILMQMMNKNANPINTPDQEQDDDVEKKDPFEPIKNIGNDNINAMLYNLMNNS